MPRASTRRSGFTLVELLVVLALVAILCAVLFPVFATAREKGRQTHCASNLHQLGLALSLYLQDSGGGFPHRFQDIQNSGHITSPGILSCMDDPTGNWGGLLYEGSRKINEPQLPPETVRHSYLDAFSTLGDFLWGRMERLKGSSSGVMVCQVHGEGWPGQWNSLNKNGAGEVWNGDYEGFLLRLQLDGAVVHRQVRWEHYQGYDDGSEPVTSADAALLFNESTARAILDATKPPDSGSGDKGDGP